MSIQGVRRETFLANALLGLGLAVALAGCATTFEETHYFQSLDPTTKTPTNYYRLKVTGYGAMTSARYVSGYYDERAVDLFFNEVKVSETASDATGVRKLFEEGQKPPGSSSDDTFKPLSPSAENGAFVMILSTNASSVTQAIGQFGENQVIADAITNLANRDAIYSDVAINTVTMSRANAVADELKILMDKLPSDTAPDKDAARRSLLRVLNTIASGYGYGPTAFQSFDEAEAWFAANKHRSTAR
jgi:hypothetical protein